MYPLRELQKYSIRARDGEIGRLADVYFERATWGVRYLVVEVGGWLSRRQLLLIPAIVEQVDREAGTIQVNLTREQVKNSPDVETEKTISREKEEALHHYYRWQPYWIIDPMTTAGLGAHPGQPVVVGMPPTEGLLKPADEKEGERQEALAEIREEDEQHGLESASEVTGYSLHAVDGDIGRVDDVILDMESWQVRYLVVDTGTWLAGRRVLVSPTWIDTIHWAAAEVDVVLTRAGVESSPEYDPESLISRDYERRLSEHHGKGEKPASSQKLL
jgi:sporulation protein YlmC with PRC-barrel domain